MNLEGVDIFEAETIRRAAKIPAELRYRVEIRLLPRRREIADRHVRDHAAAKRADLSHRKTSCLKGWVAKNPRSSQTGGDYCDCLLTAAPAASFNPHLLGGAHANLSACRAAKVFLPGSRAKSGAMAVTSDTTEVVTPPAASIWRSAASSVRADSPPQAWTGTCTQ